MKSSSPAVARMGRPYCLYPKARVRLLVAERKQFPRMTAVSYTLWWRCFIERCTINAMGIRCGNSAHIGNGCTQQPCI